jgi:hypothetical protein
MLNETPFTTGFGIFTDKLGEENVSVVVKGTFSIPTREQTSKLADEQQNVTYANDYFGEPGFSSIRHPVEVVPNKRATDVVFIGHAYAPKGRKVRELMTSITVGPLSKEILVIGDRHWKEGTFGLSATTSVPFQCMPIIYERAYGGPIKKNAEEDLWDRRNPVGKGYCVKKKNAEGLNLPNLEHPVKRIKSWNDNPPVMGYGAIDAHWLPRVNFAGTYDDQWMNNQMPLPAMDFDERFYNVGAAGLVAQGFLIGGERVSLINLSEKPHIDFYIPQVRIELIIHYDDQDLSVRPDLWMIEIEPDICKIFLIWGYSFAVGKQPSKWTSAEVKLKNIDVQGHEE